MPENKTKQTEQSVPAFLDRIEDENRRKDSIAIVELMKDASGEEPRMWGESIVGFGSYHYKYESGREGDSMLVGFSPRKQNLTLYLAPGSDQYDTLLSKLGKVKTGKGCLYINKLADVDPKILRQMVKQSAEHRRKNHPA